MKGLAYLTMKPTRKLESYIACQSSVCPDPVRFPALSQIKPHAPRVLVVPFRQFLQVSHLRAYFPRRGMSQTFLQ